MGHSEAMLFVPCSPTRPLRHCPAEQPSGFFPTASEKKPTCPSDSRVTSPLCPIPSSQSAPSDSPAGRAPPTPSPDETSFKRPLHHLTQQHHWLTFPFSRICHFLNYSFHAISFSFISLHQTEAPGNQGVLLNLFPQHLQSPQGRCSEKP